MFTLGASALSVVYCVVDKVSEPADGSQLILPRWSLGERVYKPEAALLFGFLWEVVNGAAFSFIWKARAVAGA